MPNSQINHIFECCINGKTQQLLDALEKIDDVHIVDGRQNSLISVVLKHGRWKTALALIDNNYTYANTNKPVLISACQYNKDDSQGMLYALRLNKNVDIQNEQQRTALMTVCLLGHVNKAQELLNLGANCNLADNHGNTALLDAVQSRSKKMVELILHRKPDVNQANKQNETALILELKQKAPSEDIVKQLLNAGSNPELRDDDTKSAWLIAKQKHLKISRLIEKHLNTVHQMELPFFSNNYQMASQEEIKPAIQTPLVQDVTTRIEPTIASDNTSMQPEQQLTSTITSSIKKSLIFNPKKVKKTNKQEWFHAAKTGNLGGLNRMIIEGIDINCKDDKGCTALIRACGHSRRAVVSFLLQQNADIEMRSNNGSTALSSSVIGNCRRVAGLLLDSGANPNGLGPADYSYATIAAAQWNDGMLSILYRNDSDVFICNKHQQNLLHIIALAAEFYNNVNNAKTSFEFLLNLGVDINAKDKDGNTPLMILCGNHKLQYKVDDRNIASIVHSIIKLGAAPAITNNAGKSAIDAVRHHKLPQTKGVLMNALSWSD
ncbi:hypothetical protein MNBD_GAMMA01-1489 [hydrothermal vent metagenome]|uniref:Uncharacterized protein n=1 Tax=hydrothermal vent metagenome TaxID=652676 RepID=A0A3B0VHM8_9ZZZZ